ncbi:MAG: hypothetical protein F4087_10285 [Gemmatimonadetes bacterium]|nr:hypothetical protein [Gemmatimonadota bacterium]MXX33886.1 hypothetical protein [Gemmatimonadota bacterium]MYA12260.1 hypothetical protein [Gemmatimonadota bacterium]MYD13118.1 hypothetical protein [Gemmatimonadota bacterium]MYE70516.1 hypothetical protein [Gemmatimonadota bacterium]
MKLTRMFTVLATAALAVAGGVPAQAQEGPFPEGWEVRFDREGSSMDDLRFETMPPGMHITTGPAMIAYHPDSVVTGDFRIESETFLFDPGRRREAFGFFVGGSDLQGPNQRYTYFLVREGGEFLVKTRSGTETALVQDWTAHAAIVAYATKPDDASTAKNVLVLEAEGDDLRFSINGEQVWSGSRQGLEIDGIFGLRVNHGIDIHVTTIMRSPPAASASRGPGAS